MKNEIKVLEEKKCAYDKEINTLSGLIAYYKEKNNNDNHNKIIGVLFSMVLLILSSFSVFLMSFDFKIGVSCLICSLLSYAFGLKQINNGINEGHKKIKKRYLKQYGINVDELNISEEYVKQLPKYLDDNVKMSESLKKEIRVLKERNNKEICNENIGRINLYNTNINNKPKSRILNKKNG